MKMNTIGAELRAASERARLTQADAARLIGVAPNQVYLWETGRRMPGAARYLRAMELLKAAATASDRAPG